MDDSKYRQKHTDILWSLRHGRVRTVTQSAALTSTNNVRCDPGQIAITTDDKNGTLWPAANEYCSYGIRWCSSVRKHDIVYKSVKIWDVFKFDDGAGVMKLDLEK